MANEKRKLRAYPRKRTKWTVRIIPPGMSKRQQARYVKDLEDAQQEAKRLG